MTDVAGAVVGGVHDLDRRRAADHALRILAAYVIAHTAALVWILSVFVRADWLSIREVGQLLIDEPMLVLELYRPTLILTAQSYGEVGVLVAMYVGAVVVAYGPRRIWRAWTSRRRPTGGRR